MTECPCCRQAVDVPPLDEVITSYGLTDHEAAVLRTVWKGRGMPVMPAAIFDVMYADDPDGGPTPTKMYHALKAALGGLAERLKGSGVSVVSAGYRRGYWLKLDCSINAMQMR